MKNNKILLWGLFLVTFFNGIEHTIIATAMPSIVKDLNGIEMFVWTSTIFTLASIMILPIVGKLADIFEKKKLFLVGMLLFIAGAFLSGAANSMTELIVARAIQGFGTGMTSPLTQIIIGYTFQATERAKLQGYFGMIYGGTIVIGPLIGGLLTDLVDWRWIFFINIPFGLLACILIYIGMKSEETIVKSKKTVDVLGSILVASILLIFMLWISFVGKEFNWLSKETFLFLLVFSTCIVFFAKVERKVENPIIDFSLFNNRFFSSASFLSFVSGAAKFGAISFVPLFVQIVLGTSATQAGSMLTPLLAGVILTNYLSAKAILTMRYRTVIFFGMVFSSIGYLLLSGMDNTTPITFIYACMFILGAGLGTIGSPLTIVSQTIYPKEQMGVVTSTITFFRWSGGIIGLTVMNLVMQSTFTHNYKNEIEKNGLTYGGETMDYLLNLTSKADFNNAEILQLVESTYALSFHYTFLGVFLMLILGICSSYYLGNKRMLDKTS